MNKNILKRGNFRVDVYGSIIHIVVCKDADAIQVEGNKVIKRFKEELVTYPVQALTFSPDLKGGTYYVWFCPQHLDINTITHETDHLRNYILDYCAVNETNDSKESSANLNGLINERVFAFLNRNGFEFIY